MGCTDPVPRDVAMAFLEADQTKATRHPGLENSPVHVEGNIVNGGALNGISTRVEITTALRATMGSD
eukprot:14980551-Ditylum_brightwellii.AAC.1